MHQKKKKDMEYCSYLPILDCLEREREIGLCSKCGALGSKDEKCFCYWFFLFFFCLFGALIYLMYALGLPLFL